MILLDRLFTVHNSSNVVFSWFSFCVSVSENSVSSESSFFFYHFFFLSLFECPMDDLSCTCVHCCWIFATDTKKDKKKRKEKTKGMATTAAIGTTRIQKKSYKFNIFFIQIWKQRHTITIQSVKWALCGSMWLFLFCCVIFCVHLGSDDYFSFFFFGVTQLRNTHLRFRICRMYMIYIRRSVCVDDDYNLKGKINIKLNQNLQFSRFFRKIL